MSWGRRAILRLAGSPWVGRTVRAYGPALGARRFVAGETLADAVDAVRTLNARGALATLARLGESVGEQPATVAAAAACGMALGAVAAAGARANLSVKLTQLGLDLDPDLCAANLRHVLDRAQALGNFVRIDMEDSAHTEATLRLYRRLRAEGRENVGIVVQAYLYRSLPDLEALDDLAPDVRLVKGAYDEPPTVAFKRRADIDANLRRLIERQLRRGLRTAVASHDEAILGFALETAARLGVAGDRLELQMLYGVRPALQRRLAAGGRPLRIYVPFGPDWYPYLMRRLAERPANLMLLARSLLGG